jgi:hypothetical protein
MSEESTASVAIESPTSTPSTESTSTPSTTPSTETTNASGTESTTPVVPAYTPNYKFKAWGKEFEMDKFFHPMLKDADTEKRFKELHEKAFGLDHLLPQHKEIRDRHNELNTKHGQIMEALSTSQQFLKQGDLSSFFDSWKIPREQVAKWILDQVEYEKLAPEQRSRVDAQRDAQIRAMELEKHNQSLSEQYSQLAVQTRTMQLEQAMSQPDIRTVAQVYDQRMGQPGAFKNEVINRAAMAYQSQGVDLTAEQAAHDTALAVARIMVGQQQAEDSGQTQQTQQQQARPPVIPNISSKGGSPAKRSPKSLDELRKIGQSM